MNIPKNLNDFGNAILQINKLTKTGALDIVKMKEAVQGLTQAQIVSIAVKNKDYLLTIAKNGKEMVAKLTALGLTEAKATETATIIMNTAAKGANATATGAQTAANSGLLTSIKATTAGLLAQAAAWAMTPMGMFTIAVGAIMAITNAYKSYNKAQQEIIDKAVEITRAWQDQQKTIQSTGNTINAISADYEKLARGVDNQGKNISLSTEEYQRYNDIVNQIAHMFPQMIQGYTSEGNAIIAHKGNIQELTRAYEEMKQAAQDAILISASDIWSGFRKQEHTELNAYESLVSAAQNGNRESVEYLTKNLNAYFYSLLKVNHASYETVTDNIDKIKARHRQLVSAMNVETAKIRPIFNAFMETDYDFNKLSGDLQNIAKNIVDTFDYPFFAEFKNENDVYAWIKENIITPLSNPQIGNQVQEILNNLFNIDRKESAQNIANQAEEIRKTLRTLLPELDIESILINLGFTVNREELDNLVSRIPNYIKLAITKDLDFAAYFNFDELRLLINLSEEEFKKFGTTVEDVKTGLSNLRINNSEFTFLSNIVAGLTEDLTLLNIVQRDFGESLNLSEKELDEYEKALSQLKNTYPLLYDAIVRYNSVKIAENEQLVLSVLNHYQEQEALKQSKNTYEDNISVLQKLYSVQKDANDGKKMSYFQMLELIMQYPQLAGSIKLTETGYILEGNALERLITLKREDLRLTLESQRARAVDEFRLIDSRTSDRAIENITSMIQSGEITSGSQYIESLKRQHGEAVNILNGLEEYIDTIIGIEKALEFSAGEIKFPTIDTVSSSNKLSLDRLLDTSNLYLEQLSDIEKKLLASEAVITNLQSALSRAQEFGDENAIKEYNNALIKEKEKQVALYQELVKETRDFQNRINDTFKDFANVDMSDFGVARFRQNLGNQITMIDNQIAKTEEDSVKRSLELQKQGLQTQLDRFNEYESAIKRANELEIKYRGQVQNLQDEIYIQQLKQNDDISDKQIEALYKIYEKTSDEVDLRAALVKLSEDENISLTQKLKILERIADLDMGEYNRQIADIDYAESFLPETDFDARIKNVQNRMTAAQQSINDLMSQNYGENSDNIGKLYQDIFSYEQDLYNLRAKRHEFDINNLEHELYLYQQNNADNLDYNKIADYYGQIQNKLHALANERRAHLSNLGLSAEEIEFDSFIESLQRKWWEFYELIRNIPDLIIKDAISALDSIEKVYSALEKAGKEIADTGVITTDTFKAIASMGIEYLSYLTDENGQLDINRERIQDVIRAKTEQLAVESALNYVNALSKAYGEGRIDELERLLYATKDLTGSTWDLVEAKLAEIGLEDDYLKAARGNLEIFRKYADSAKDGVGMINAQTIEINKLYEAEIKLKTVQEKRAALERDINSSVMPDGKLEYLHEVIALYHREIEALGEINRLRSIEINDNIARLRSQGFDVDYDPSSHYLLIKNLSHINDIMGDTTETTDALRKEYDDLIKTTHSLVDANKADASSMIDAADALTKALDSIVDKANAALDKIENVYKTFLDAAQEFADSGFITVDTFQKILSMGVQYLAYLVDENGQLNINEQAVQNVIAAKTEQVAAETALNYIRSVQQALMANDIETLNHLIFATETYSSSTWDLVYANVELAKTMGLTNEAYHQVIRNINTIRSVADSAKSSIGQMTGQLRAVREEAERVRLAELREQERALNDLLRYVMDMIRWETSLRIDGIRDQIKAFEELIGLRKQELREMERKRDFERDMGRQTRDLARLQNQLAVLERDNSGDPAIAARRRQIAEQIADMQGRVDEDIHKKYVEEQEKAYDEDLKLFRETKEQQIRVLEDTISSTEKLYRLVLDRISQQWATLFEDLIHWNYQAGSAIGRDLVSSWDNASVAVQRYGSYLEALLRTQEQINILTNSMSMSNSTAASSGDVSRPITVANTGSFETTPSVYAIQQANEQLRQPNEQKQTSEQLKQANAKDIVSQMQRNSLAWHTANTTEQQRLADANQDLANKLSVLIGRRVVRNPSSGHWYLDGIGQERLYEATKFHTGGIVGQNPTPKENEVLSLLEKKEAVLTENQKENMIDAVDTLKSIKLGFEDIFKTPNRSKINIADFFEQIKKPHLINDMLSGITQGIANQSREIINNNSESASVHIEKIEVPVIVRQKIEKSDIQELGKEIADVAMGAIVNSRRDQHGFNKGSAMQRI